MAETKKTDSEFSPFKVLIVEDNEFVRFMVKKHLTSFGVEEIYQASDGMEGISLLEEKQPDIAICDINMKPINGFEFLEHVRRLDPPMSDMPVIFLTSSADEDAVKKAVSLKVDAYLLKPVLPKNLKQKLTHLLFERDKEKGGEE